MGQDRRRPVHTAWPWLLPLLLSSCTHQELRPAPAASSVPGTKATAEAEEAGVHVVVDGSAWIGNPLRLRSVVPVKVAIENRSGVPIAIRYRNFTLTVPSGDQLAALPPLVVAHKALVEGAPAFTASPVEGPYTTNILGDEFYVAGPFGPYYPAFPPWPGIFPFDDAYYDRYHGDWPSPLPTEDMISKVLPEGVIDTGGNVKGFIFFQKVPAGVTMVQFRAHLVDARTGKLIGVVTIPLLPVKEG